MRERLSWCFGHSVVACAIAVSLMSVALDAAADPAPARPAEGGESVVGPLDEITDQQREAIWQQLDQNREALRAAGQLPAFSSGVPPLLYWPLRAVDGLEASGYMGISGYVDQNPLSPNQIQDYNCGFRTYDTTDGYNHQGIDYFTWPYPMLWMDNFQIEVVAAAAGVIIGKDDGNSDRSCNFNSNPWNAVYIEHADGSIIWYGHLKNGSLTSKSPGQSVATGEYLGVVASSGNSTTPHLHFELYDSGISLQEPHDGACNVMNPGFSWWANQESYRVPGINLLTIGWAPPGINTCPTLERPNLESNFVVNEIFYMTAYFRDQLFGNISELKILRPDGTIRNNWTQDEGDYNASWWWWTETFTQADPVGVYRWQVTHVGVEHEVEFRLGSANPAGRVATLTVGKTGTDVTLNWTPGCLGDVDYVIYEGQLGDFSSHTSVTCSTGNVNTYTLTPGFDDAYYIAAARNVDWEGSSGKDGDGNERSQATVPCMPQDAGLCLQSVTGSP